jgi:hypothetical protein
MPQIHVEALTPVAAHTAKLTAVPPLPPPHTRRSAHANTRTCTPPLLRSESLRSAMLDVYLGKNAVSPSAKKDFADGMAGMLSE